ncbi:hypothetical protein [uncultured Methanobrevibacter sp.]|uniref:hypothetical protein n=1 Tax=uncultured Methanobrevibacter sp. TaxID=253161 RepID=UPI00261D6ECD|nr:hypothetical protein [uncultured Methanobrevibacter sp.]
MCALIVILAVPLIPTLISSTTTNYANELANSFNLFASIYLFGIVIGLIITAILYFVAALVYET